MEIFNIFNNEIAIDLGTANTLVYVRNKGVVINEPSIVAINKRSNKLIAIGQEAKEMMGRTHDEIVVVRPLKDGVIADFEMTELMLQEFIRKVSPARFMGKRVVIGVPVGITMVEQRAVRDSAEHAGAKEVYLVAEPMAAAIGVGIDITESKGSMIMDIGGGTAEIAVIALSGIVCDRSIRNAGDELTKAIVQYFRIQHNLLLGDQTAEEIKCTIGSAVPLPKELTMEIKGRDIVSGIPRTLATDSAEVRKALNEPISKIIEGTKNTLERTPPELASDILDRGIVLTGGGALIKGLDERIKKETGLPVIVAEDPLTAVVRGVGIVLENLSKYQQVILKAKKY
ncbi:rod shape-determining protein [bacterium]|nr:MAG: rod shape-determining protein [bacterium]